MKKITIRGIIGLSDNATPEHLEAEIADAGSDDLTATFASPGGLVSAGIEMSNMIRAYAGRTTAIITGQAASMASYMPMMFDRVVAYDNTVFMIHNPMGGVFGADYREATRFTAHMLSIRDLLARAYAVKSGKPIEEINQMMDDETFLYGQEIVDHGFADELIKSDGGPENKSEAIAIAKTGIEACQSKMKENEAALKSDFEQVAAYFKQPENKATQPPASAGTTQKMEAKMETLQEFLAAKPAAKAEHDVALASARTEGETAGNKAGKEEMKATITAASPFLNNKEYPTLGALALKVITGEEAAATLTISVTAIDALKEQNNQTAAEDEQGDETNATGAVSTDEKVEADFQTRLGNEGGAK